MSNKFIFAPIDAKDMDIIALYRLDKRDYINRPEHIENVRVIAKARNEYLTKLKELQTYIKEKYEPQIKADAGMKGSWTTIPPTEAEERENLLDGNDDSMQFSGMFYT